MDKNQRRRRRPARDGKKYRWLNPYEWLLEKLHGSSSDGRMQIACLLARHVDVEAIFTMFQPEMIQDGYFDPEEARQDKPEPQVQCPTAAAGECSSASVCDHATPHTRVYDCPDERVDCPSESVDCPACVEVVEEKESSSFIRWHCVACGCGNDDSPELTSTPLCVRCGAEYEWTDLNEYLDLVKKGAEDASDQ